MACACLCLHECVSGGVRVCAGCWKGGLCLLVVDRGRVAARVPLKQDWAWARRLRTGRVEAGPGGAAFAQLPGSWGINGGPGKASSPGQPDPDVLTSSTPRAPSSSRPDAVVLESGRAEVTLLWALEQIIPFTVSVLLMVTWKLHTVAAEAG